MKKRISVLNLALALSLLIPAPPSANAQETTRKEHRRMNWAENLPESVRNFHGKRFTVLHYHTQHETGHHPKPGTKKEIEAIRSAVRGNKWLTAELRARKIIPEDIQWVERTMNGSLIFYIK